jgi:hypothetical protein
MLLILTFQDRSLLDTKSICTNSESKGGETSNASNQSHDAELIVRCSRAIDRQAPLE